MTKGLWEPGNQNPCDVLTIFKNTGIEVQANILNAYGWYDCFSTTYDFQVNYMESMNEFVFLLEPNLKDLDICNPYMPITPYDGGYSILPESDANGYFTYRSSNNYQVSMTSIGYWEFQNFAGVLGPMTDLYETEQMYPVSHHGKKFYNNF